MNRTNQGTLETSRTTVGLKPTGRMSEYDSASIFLANKRKGPYVMRKLHTRACLEIIVTQRDKIPSAHVDMGLFWDVVG